jgi:hypothetical protein
MIRMKNYKKRVMHSKKRLKSNSKKTKICGTLQMRMWIKLIKKLNK